MTQVHSNTPSTTNNYQKLKEDRLKLRLIYNPSATQVKIKQKKP